MQVNEVMSRQVDLIDPNTMIREAAKKMRDDRVGALPVGENDRLVGMVRGEPLPESELERWQQAEAPSSDRDEDA